MHLNMCISGSSADIVSSNQKIANLACINDNPPTGSGDSYTNGRRGDEIMDQEKFRTLVHYVCSKCDDPTKLGATKLNKILWYSERAAYLRLGSSITGAVFVKRQYGPVPRAILPALRELQESNDIVIRETQLFGKPKREFISITEPSLNKFTADEISLVDRVIDEVCFDHTAVSISDKSHDEVWNLAEIGEEIPLNSAFGIRGEVTEEHMDWAKSQLALA
jgi:Protein of unknown function (DUF4065)